MQKEPRAVEESDDRGVDMPNFVGFGGANPDLRLLGIDPAPGTSPAIFPDEPVPGGRRGEDFARPLSAVQLDQRTEGVPVAVSSLRYESLS